MQRVIITLLFGEFCAKLSPHVGVDTCLRCRRVKTLN